MLAPPEKATQIYGFASFAGQVAGLIGPFLFATLASATGLPRIGFIICFAFMAVGVYMFTTIPASEFKFRQAAPVVAGEEQAVFDKHSHKQASFGAGGSYGAAATEDPDSPGLAPTRDAARNAV